MPEPTQEDIAQYYAHMKTAFEDELNLRKANESLFEALRESNNKIAQERKGKEWVAPKEPSGFYMEGEVVEHPKDSQVFWISIIDWNSVEPGKKFGWIKKL